MGLSPPNLRASVSSLDRVDTTPAVGEGHAHRPADEVVVNHRLLWGKSADFWVN